jgi:hypothetical protein
MYFLSLLEHSIEVKILLYDDNKSLNIYIEELRNSSIGIVYNSTWNFFTILCFFVLRTTQVDMKKRAIDTTFENVYKLYHFYLFICSVSIFELLNITIGYLFFETAQESYSYIYWHSSEFQVMNSIYIELENKFRHSTLIYSSYCLINHVSTASSKWLVFRIFFK